MHGKVSFIFYSPVFLTVKLNRASAGFYLILWVFPVIFARNER